MDIWRPLTIWLRGNNMIATFQPSRLAGTIEAPPSKSMAHRYLIGAALAEGISTLSGVDYSQDIRASIDCLKALGAEISLDGDTVTVDSRGFLQAEAPLLPCGESGSTLRFLIPLALCMDRPVTLQGSRRLLERPLEIYEDLCRENGFSFRKDEDSVTVCGSLRSGCYSLRGNISSQFITGLIFALVYRKKEAFIQIQPPLESRPYVDLTIAALADFGADVHFTDAHTIRIRPSQLRAYNGSIEGDYSNGAFLDVFNHIGGDVRVNNLKSDTLQGDRVYKTCFAKISAGTPVVDLSDCPDLGPVLFALAALKNGAVFTGTDRLKGKESDRGMAMHQELEKLGGGLIFGDNSITVPKQNLQYKGAVLSGHNDHRIVMAMSVILSQTGGMMEGVQAVRKSYPGFFEDLRRLGADVELH